PIQRDATKEDAPAASGVQRAEPEVRKAETSQEKVQRAASEGKTHDAHVQGATGEGKKDTPVQRSGAEEKKDAATVQRACCCAEGQAERRPSGTATVLCKFHTETVSDESVRRKEAGGMDAAAAHA